MNLINKRLMSFGLAAVLGAGILGGAGLAVASDEAGATVERIAGHRHKGAAVGAAQLIKASGLDREVVKAGLKDGQTLEQIFVANGIDPAVVTRDVLADLDARLAGAVAKGRLSEAQAAEARVRAAESIERALTAEPGKHVKHHIAKNVIQNAAAAIGVSPDQLVSALKDGKSIAQVAGERGVPVEEVVDAIVAPANEHIDNSVAKGRITPERGAELKEKVRDRAEEAVNRSK